MQNFDANSTRRKEVRTNERTNEQTNERTNIRTDERKNENYIPLGINAGGITNQLNVGCLPSPFYFSFYNYISLQIKPFYSFSYSCYNKKLATSKAYSIPPAMCRSKPCKFVKNYFFSIKLLHAHLQYVCNIPAKYQMNILKALGIVDFTKYALLPISQYVQWSKIGYVKNAVNLSKIFFLQINSSCTSTMCL